MESCPQKANRVTVNTQHWVHHLHLPPPLPLHLWTTLSPILQILPNLSSTVVRVIKKPGIVFPLETPVGGWDGGKSLSLLSKDLEGHLSCPLEQCLLSTRALLFPADRNLFWLPCCGSGLEVHLIRNIMMLLFQAPSCPITPMPLEPNVINCPEAFPVSLVLFLLPQPGTCSCWAAFLPCTGWGSSSGHYWLGALPSCVISLGYLLPCSFQVSLSQQ